MRNAIIFLVVGGAIAFLVNLFMKTKVDRSRATPVAKPAPVSPDREKRLAALEKAVGLRKMAVRRDERTVYLDVSVHIERRCDIGDGDLIAMEMDHSDEKRLLVSLEPVGIGTTMKPVVVRTGPELLKNGLTHTFEVPRGAQAKRLALFVCKDSTKVGHCQGKPYADLNEMFAEYGKGKDRARNPPDRIYFFQFVSLQDEEYAAVFERAVVTRDNIARLPDYLRETDASAPATALANDARYVAGVQSAAVSLPIRLGVAMQVDLPMHDAVACKPLSGRK